MLNLNGLKKFLIFNSKRFFYFRQDFYNSIDYSIAQFANISQVSVGAFGYQLIKNDPKHKPISVVSFCQKYYALGMINPTNFSYKIDNLLFDACIKIDNLFPPGDPRWNNFSILNYSQSKNFSINFNRLLVATIKFPLRTIYLNSVARNDPPECYDLDVIVK